MVISSVLVAGGGVGGCACASVLAQHGLEVVLVEDSPPWDETDDHTLLPIDTGRLLSEIGVAAPSDGVNVTAALAMRMRELAVEVRSRVQLIGAAAVDRHVEAELSDGHIENYDLILVFSLESGVRFIANDSVLRSDAVATFIRILAPTR